MNKDMVSYYSDRAGEYDKIYEIEERQEDLSLIKDLLHEMLKGWQILDVACGTGYWTEHLAHKAAAIHGFDVNDSVLEIAKKRNYGEAEVTFEQGDVFDYSSDKKWESLFGGFIWSHILVQELPRFLNNLHKNLKSGALVIFVDNTPIGNSNYKITYEDGLGNTFQTRYLQDGSSHQVLKNFPSVGFLIDILRPLATNIEIQFFEYYWILSYRIR
ncbi:MAG: class I SAM-dependent methyltransferase [Cyclobacteriaceae bacterium]|nr:class I SAM-dependent methyltransferase [Cyclobacteriaceae bacterium HetDA_MAG_MS6]